MMTNEFGTITRRRSAARLPALARMVLIPLLAAAIASGSRPALAAEPLPVVPGLDLDRYTGTWYEIARYPNFFERSCARDVTANYTRNADGTITVVNACRRDDGTMQSAKGVARVVAPAKLEVRFAPAWLGWLPFVWGDYWVIEIAPDYGYAVVGEPSREYLWILARESRLDEATYARITAGLARFGYDAGKLLRNPPPAP